MGAMTYPFGVDKSNHNYRGNKHTVEVIANPSTTYATGGETIPLGPLGLRQIHAVEQMPTTQSGLSVQLGGTPQAPLLLLFETLNTQVANGTNQSSRALGLRFIGI